MGSQGASMTEDFAGLTDWFIERARAELPMRIHSRDTDDGGYPQWHPSFTSYINDNGYGTTVEDEQVYCYHPIGKVNGHCEVCDDTGLRIITRSRKARPMKAALLRIGKMPVPSYVPGYQAACWALLVNDGNIAMAGDSLSPTWVIMGNPGLCLRWTHIALKKLKAAYREDVPARELRDRSDAQLDAEADARLRETLGRLDISAREVAA
jgi:hypothetical protein